MASISYTKDLDNVCQANCFGMDKHLVLHSAFFTSLLILAAIPLLVLRGSPVLEQTWVLPTTVLGEIALLTTWVRSLSISRPNECPSFRISIQGTIQFVLLAMISFFAFYLPQKLNFWGGYDEFQAFQPTVACLWGFAFDNLNGRPALGWSYVFGRVLGSGTIDGYIWMSGIQSLINASLLYAIVQLLLPQSRAIAIAAAILLIVNRADPLKFFPLWAANPYNLAVGFWLLGFWLFLVSWRQRNRALLVVACLSFGITLLMYEVGYLLAAIPLIVLWTERKSSPLWKLWCFSLVATISLFAVRVAVFQLTSGSSYQLSQVGSKGISPGDLLSNLYFHLLPTVRSLSFSFDFQENIAIALTVFALATSAVWISGSYDERQKAHVLLKVVGIAALGIFLGVGLYSHMKGNERTQFFAGPFQAVFIAMILGSVYLLLSKSMARATLSLIVGFVAASSTVASFREQDKTYHITYDKLVHVSQQIRALSSTIAKDKLIIVLIDGKSPLGANYATYDGSRYWLGPRMLQILDVPDWTLKSNFEDGKVALELFDKRLTVFPTQDLIVFKLDADGTLYLQPEWPSDQRLPKDVDGYSPLANLSTGPINMHPDLDFPSWSGPPNDIVRQREGIVLGRGWSSLKYDSGWLYRNAEQNAELFVNSQGHEKFEVDLDLCPISAPKATTTIEIVNSQNDPVASFELSKREKFHISLPSNSKHVEMFRLRVKSMAEQETTGPIAFRVFVPKGPFAINPVPEEPDITSGGVQLGRGWYDRERYNDRQLRWLNTEGTIITGPTNPGVSPRLVLEVCPGPGMAGQPCTLEICDPKGLVMASKTVTQLESIAFEFPVDFPEGTAISLRVLDGGKSTPNDPRILNVVVTRCEWLSNPTPNTTAPIVKLTR